MSSKGRQRPRKAPAPMRLSFVQEKGKCPTGKLRYPTAIDAGLALGRAKSGRPVKGQDAKVEVRHYLCQHCQGHHLTSAPLR